ncbi:MAG TPA: TlpA disulfide reductase family protein [Polyangia bacterium]|jgi:peroxiredoxin|nr:TlpA disulfide reductase family protein [Polyangia bacterium]
MSLLPALLSMVFLAAPLAAVAGAVTSADGSDLIGKLAPPWLATEWLGSPPLSLADLRGKVVLVRWFMSTDCPYCTATAPSLNQLHQEFKDRGLVVIGMYHHKNPEPLDARKVSGWAHEFGFQFPIAIDRDWRTLHRWWLDGHNRDFTSVTFLIDGKGVVRRIHPGGTMAPGTKDYQAMRSTIVDLLSEPRGTPRGP